MHSHSILLGYSFKIHKPQTIMRIKLTIFYTYNDNDRRAAGYNGYVVHIEQNYLQNRSLIFRNCEFLSDNSHCVGCGLRKGCNLVFDNCIFRSFVTGSGSMFLHDTPIDGDYGSCDVSIKDCQFYTHNSTTPPAISRGTSKYLSLFALKIHFSLSSPMRFTVLS